MGAVKRAKEQVEEKMLNWLAGQLQEPVGFTRYEFETQRRRPDGMEIEEYIASRTKK